MKKTICIFLILAVIGASAFGASASDKNIATECYSDDVLSPLEALPADASVIKDGSLNISAKSCVLMEANTGTVLYEENADERLAPASITKVMSLLLITEAIDKGRLKLEDTVSASEHAASMGGSQIWLEPGEKMTVDELLRAAVIASANDATVALAESVYGSEETFVEQMNKKAESMGLENSRFENCTGLDADGHYMSARDVAAVSAELLSHKLIIKYSSVWMDSLRNGKSELVNTNKLVHYYSGCTGLKTGTTSSAGCCLSASATRNGLELVAVVMGSPNSKERFSGAVKMLDYGFANWEFATVTADLGNARNININNGKKQTAGIMQKGDLMLLLKKGEASDISQKIILPKSINAPVKKGDIVGAVKVFAAKKPVGEIEICATETVKRATVFTVFGWLFALLLK